MEDIFRSIVLGIVQGLTEFLPVSSSGHLEIGKYILGSENLGEGSLLFTIILHFATALSTIVVFRKEVAHILKGLFSSATDEHRSFTLKIVLSMVPAAFVGVIWEDVIDGFFTSNILLVSLMLIVTACLLFLADRVTKTSNPLTYLNAFIIGVAQAVAIMPGISRSGATISTSVLLGIDREEAAKFSFLMVVPLIFGKMFKEFLDGDIFKFSDSYVELSTGFIAAFITGILACTWMIKIVKESKLKYFAFYCLLVALIGIVYVVLSK